MRLVVLALAAAGALAGCLDETADWHGDSRFTEAERAAIVEGDAWLAKQAGHPASTFDWTYEVTSAEPLAHTIRRERGPDGDHGTTGWCSDIGGAGALYLDPDDSNAAPGSLAGLAAHELAHCEFGLHDDAESEGLMRVVQPMRWTDRERAQCAATGRCAR